MSDTSSVVNTEKEEIIVEESTEEHDTSEPSSGEDIIEEVVEEDEPLECPVYDPDPFIDHVVSYTEGEGAGLVKITIQISFWDLRWVGDQTQGHLMFFH